jgi:ABC-type Zn uptake system ZnuABC Zn-binding protein ZnuA
MKTLIRCTLLLLAFGGALAGAAEAPQPLVLTGTQATYSLTTALAAGTPIEVRNIPADGRQLSLLKDYIERRMDALAPTFAAATAVVTLTNALPGDPLFRFAREANIRIVDIEAAIPWSSSTPGVALAASPVSSVPWVKDADVPETATAPYFWLSVSNSIRMADLIAHDLAALFPANAPRVRANLETLKRSLLGLRNDYQNQLIAGGGELVFALTGDFVYLTNDMGLLVDGYFIKQDVRWTPTDLAQLTKHLREHDIKTVIHKWMPAQNIQDAVKAAGARIVVLATGDPGNSVDGKLAPDGLQQLLRSNLADLQSAFGGQDRREGNERTGPVP